jgi:hypothetical protein
MFLLQNDNLRKIVSCRLDYVRPLLFKSNSTMALQDDFNAAVAASKELTKRPSNEELLDLICLLNKLPKAMLPENVRVV